MQMDLTTRKNGPAVRQLKEWLERLFLLLVALYMFYRISKVTTLSLPYPKNAEKILCWALSIVALVRVPFLNLKGPKVWLALGMACVCHIVYAVGGYSFMRFIAALLVGFVDVDYKRILRVWLPVACAVIAVAFAAALTGATSNLVQYNRDGMRSSWGICYPTDCSTLVLFTTIALWVALERIPGWGMLLLTIPSLALSYFFTNGRNSLMCGAALCLVILWDTLETRSQKRGRGMGWLTNCADTLVTFAFPIFAVGMFLLIFLYSRHHDQMQRLNDLMSFRLELSLNAIRAHGFLPFGSKFSQAGYGFSVFPPLNYSFIDSSYVLIPVRYGWVLFLAICAMWVVLARKAIRCGRRRLALAMAVIAFHSIMEHHFIEPHYNIFLTMLFAAIPETKPDILATGRADKVSARRTATAALLTAALVGALLWLTLPWAFTRLRTVISIKGWLGDKQKAWFVVVTMLGCVSALVLGICAAFSLISAAVRRSRPELRVIPMALVCALIVCGVHVWSERAIVGAYQAESELLDSEEAAMRTVLNAATGGVYVNEQPTVYDRRFGGIALTMLAGDDLARYDGASAIMDVAAEHNVFFQRGYSFAQISDQHGVYTSDPAVIDALTAAGYMVTDYFSAPIPVDLKAIAKQNHLKYNKEYGMLVKGEDRSLKKGPQDELYEGTYAVTYSLRLSKDAPEENSAASVDIHNDADLLLCKLKVTSYKGEYTLAEEPIYFGQFDNDGCLTVQIPFTSGMARNVEFLALSEGNNWFYISDIHYQKTEH